MALDVLLNFLMLLNVCYGLLCYNCHDYNAERSICSSLTSCRGSNCLLVYHNQDFVSTCSNEVINVDDFCWIDESQRTLCVCKTQNCNTIINASQIRNATTNPTSLNTSAIIEKFIHPSPATPDMNGSTQSPQTTTTKTSVKLHSCSIIIILILISKITYYI